MTTNSPNPVDGDVQSLIAFLQEKITSLKFAAKQHAFEDIRDELVMELRSAEIALAALTAEPFSYAHTKVITDLVDKRRCCGTVWLKSDDESSVEPLHAIYTTPPAQLLRPVELPKRKSMLTREEVGEDYTTCMAVPLDDVIAALENAGVPYEVKND